MTSPQKKAKVRGYRLEKDAEAALRSKAPGIKRTGSVNYKASAPDLYQDGFNGPLLLVVTRDRRQQMLVTMSLDDFLDRVDTLRGTEVAVQCKAREVTWVGSLYQELKKAVKNL